MSNSKERLAEEFNKLPKDVQVALLQAVKRAKEPKKETMPVEEAEARLKQIFSSMPEEVRKEMREDLKRNKEKFVAQTVEAMRQVQPFFRALIEATDKTAEKKEGEG